MQAIKRSPIGIQSFRVYVSGTENSEISGEVICGLSTTGVKFSSLSKLILLMDSFMDCPVEQPEYIEHSLENPSFEIDVLFRQNYTWQGRVRWPKEGKEAVFRSALELIAIIETISSAA